SWPCVLKAEIGPSGPVPNYMERPQGVADVGDEHGEIEMVPRESPRVQRRVGRESRVRDGPAAEIVFSVRQPGAVRIFDPAGIDGPHSARVLDRATGEFEIQVGLGAAPIADGVDAEGGRTGGSDNGGKGNGSDIHGDLSEGSLNTTREPAFPP